MQLTMHGGLHLAASMATVHVTLLCNSHVVAACTGCCGQTFASSTHRSQACICSLAREIRSRRREATRARRKATVRREVRDDNSKRRIHTKPSKLERSHSNAGCFGASSAHYMQRPSQSNHSDGMSVRHGITHKGPYGP